MYAASLTTTPAAFCVELWEGCPGMACLRRRAISHSSIKGRCCLISRALWLISTSFQGYRLLYSGRSLMEVPQVGQQGEAEMAVNHGHWPEAGVWQPSGSGLVARLEM